MKAGLLVEKLIRNRQTIALAESCTGGGIAAVLTAIPGSSQCFGLGVVSYSNQAKERLLRVPEAVLRQFGAVSAETAAEMARGLRNVTGSRLCVSVTGIAGPDGGTEEKPAGLFYVAVLFDGKLACERFHGRNVSRDANRHFSMLTMMRVIDKMISA